MNLRSLFLAGFVAILPCAVSGAPDDHHGKSEKTTELGEQMDHLGSAFRKLRRQAGEAAKNESSLELVATMRGAAEAALKLVPAKAADLPEADRAKFVAAYQEQMQRFIGTLDALAKALKAGDNAEAQKLVGELGSLQKAGHKEYKKPERD